MIKHNKFFLFVMDSAKYVYFFCIYAQYTHKQVRDQQHLFILTLATSRLSVFMRLFMQKYFFVSSFWTPIWLDCDLMWLHSIYNPKVTNKTQSYDVQRRYIFIHNPNHTNIDISSDAGWIQWSNFKGVHLSSSGFMIKVDHEMQISVQICRKKKWPLLELEKIV